MAGTLYVVATPIGNLGDMTLRAVEVLGSVDLVACEDTRHTGLLLKHHGIEARTLSYHEHNERERAAELVRRLLGGESVALVSDAGTPGLSDPGYRLVSAARAAGLRIEAVPGPSAALAALSVSGLPTDSFTFAGFLPHRKAARHRVLQDLAGETRTLVFYESPHRLAASLEDMAEVLGRKRPCFLAREMTKLHEEHLSGTLGDLAAEIADRERVKGEVTLVVAGARPVASGALSRGEVLGAVERLEQKEGLTRMQAIKRVARKRGLPKSVIYDTLLDEEE